MDQKCNEKRRIAFHTSITENKGGGHILHCLFHIILRQICLVFICPNRAIRGVFITRQAVLCNTVMDEDTI